MTEPTLPAHVLRGLKAVDGSVKVLEPDVVRRGLQKLVVKGVVECAPASAPSPLISRREWIISLATFCASDGVEKLDGLPLALLEDGRVRTFSKDDPVYVARGDERRILGPLPRRMLDPEFQSAVLKNRPVPTVGVRELNLAGVVEVAQEVLRADPPTGWSIAVFEFLDRASTEPMAAKALPLIPGNDGCRHTMGHLATPLLPGNHPPVLVQALSRLGVPLFDGPQILLAAVTRFAQRHVGFIWSVTPKVVANILVGQTRNPSLKLDAFKDPAVRELVLDLLSSDDGNAVRQNRDALRKLAILPTLSGDVVAADEEGVFAPTEFEPPLGVGVRSTVLSLGPAQRWRAVADALNVPRLDAMRFVADVLLPSFSAASPAMLERLLTWLRDEFPRVEVSIGAEQRRGLREQIRGTPILPVRGGGLAAPAHTYAPDATEVEGLLGRFARKPDLRRFGEQRDLWDRFFGSLDLPRQPLAADLYAALTELVCEAKARGAHGVRDAVLRLAKHIDGRWAVLSSCPVEPGVTLGAALRALAWLPARRLGPHECPAALVPDNRLFRADELAAHQIRRLVASCLPVLDWKDMSDEMATALRLRTEASVHEVLAHLDRLRTDPVPKPDNARRALRQSFLGVVHFLGSKRGGLADELTAWLQQRASDRLVLVGVEWHHPSRVFLRRLSVSFPGAVCVHDDAQLVSEIAGLSRLGVRECPSPDDWIGLLDELHRQFGVEPLPEQPLKVARGALCELRACDPAWLRARTVWVPAHDHLLVPARQAYLPNDPRLRAGPLPTTIELVEDIAEIVAIAERAGARSLRASLREMLHEEETFESSSADHREWRAMYERRVRSREFWNALRRVAYEAAVRDGHGDPMVEVDAGRLERVRSLRICVAERLRIQSRLSDDDTVVFNYEPASFLDEATEMLWIRAGAMRRMLDELVRAVSKLCGVEDTLLVSRLLDAEPDAMRAVLDEGEIADVPTGRKLQDTDIASHTSGDGGEWLAELDGEGEPEGGKAASDGGEAAPEGGEGGREDGGGDQLDGAGDVENERGGEASVSAGGPRAMRWRGLGRARRDDSSAKGHARVGGGTGALDPHGPRLPGHGSSNPWDPEGSRWSRGHEGGDLRSRSYAHFGPQADYDTGAAASPAPELESAALARVRAWEAENGRVETGLVNGLLDGFDLISGVGDEQRLIAVRGIDGPWTARGVGLTRKEIEAGAREGDRWWLYVVEHTLDPQRATVHALRNPVGRADELRLDGGWRAVAEGATSPGEPPLVGETVELEDGRAATITEVDGADGLFEVVLLFPDGESSQHVWRPNWKRRS